MKQAPIFAILSAATLVLAAAPLCLAGPAMSGDYVEARTSDVYTGSCFAMSEVNLQGQEAVFGWRVRQGVWHGVNVEGLSVVAVVRAAATLGDPTRSPLPARSVLLVDQRADLAQRDALVGFAREMAGDLLADVVAIDSVPIELSVSSDPGQAGHHGAAGLSASATLKAGENVEISTRAMNHDDHICGNEELYYPPLTATTEAVPAVTLAHAFRGTELGKTWSSPGKRSAFVGRFAR